jgi:hypothetical protein
MNLLRLAPTLAACFLSLPAAAQAPIRLHVDVDERANAIFHLGCLAETIICTKSVFDRFWEDDMVWTDEDRAALEAWRTVMSTVTWNAMRPANAPLVPNSASFHAGETAREAVIVAAMDSTSETELVKKSGRAIRTGDAKRLLPAIDHFQQRLTPWLESAVDSNLRAHAEEAEALAERSGFAETMTQMMKFLESDLDSPDVYLHLIVPPDPDSEHSIATVLRRHLVVEAVDADAESLVSVAVHELTHHLFDRAPIERHRALIDEFVSSGMPAAVGLYTYLNEAVAIGAQALHAERQDENGDYWSEDDPYDHPYIAPLGDAAAPLVIDAVARGDTLFDGFVPRYIEAGTLAVLTNLREPKFVLAQVVLLEPRGGEEITATFMAKLTPHASAQFVDAFGVSSYPSAPLVRCVRYDQLRPLTRQIPELAPLTASRGFAYAIKRGPIASTFVLAGRETNDVIDVVTKLSELPSLPAEGLLFTLD